MLPTGFGLPFSKVEERLEPPDSRGCRLWPGALDGKRYGAVKYRGRVYATHRIMYLYTYGSIPEGLVIDHLCRVTSCSEPAHLRATTQRVNLASSPLTAWSEETCAKGHLWSEVDRVPPGMCGVCLRERWRVKAKRRYWRQKALSST